MGNSSPRRHHRDCAPSVIAKDLGYNVRDDDPREMLYLTDEIFLHRHSRRDHASAFGHDRLPVGEG